MISRVAEHCYWMSRYLERAEDTARVIEVNGTLLLDSDVPLEQQWKPLLIISGIYDMDGPPDAEAVQEFMTWEPKNPSSIVSSLGAARENARIIREVISAEMWERINYYYLWLTSPASRALYQNNRHEFYSQVRRINQLVQGIADGTMSHGEAWEFFRLGTYLERGSQTSRILDVKYHVLMPTAEHVGTPIDNAHWVGILTSCSGYEPYHKRVRLPADTGTAVAEFLIFDARFPRSVLFCLNEVQKAVHEISGRPVGSGGDEVERQLSELTGWMSGMTIADVIRLGLHETLTRVVDAIHDIGDAVRTTYFEVSIPERVPRTPVGAK